MSIRHSLLRFHLSQELYTARVHLCSPEKSCFMILPSQHFNITTTVMHQKLTSGICCLSSLCSRQLFARGVAGGLVACWQIRIFVTYWCRKTFILDELCGCGACGTGVEGEANVVHFSWPANIKSIYKTLV